MAYDNKYTQPSPPAAPQSLILENRGRLSVSGVSNIISYDENTVLMETSKGRLQVKGENLHITKLTLETGDASLDGTIDSLVFENSSDNRNGFFAQLFR